MSTAAAASPVFDAHSRDAVYRAIHQRRDMRHFAGGAIADATLRRLLEAAHAAPSVGLSQPWRFIRITDTALRESIHALVREEVVRTADALGSRREEFLQLKVEGIRACAELLVVAVADGGAQEIFGRRTLPEMSLASVACAIQNLWLAARADNLGMGWVSMFEPAALAAMLALPADCKPIAVLCLGPVDAFYASPMLQEQRWREPRPLDELLSENGATLSPSDKQEPFSLPSRERHWAQAGLTLSQSRSGQMRERGVAQPVLHALQGAPLSPNPSPTRGEGCDNDESS